VTVFPTPKTGTVSDAVEYHVYVDGIPAEQASGATRDQYATLVALRHSLLNAADILTKGS
jgi:hypothetical protein